MRKKIGLPIQGLTVAWVRRNKWRLTITISSSSILLLSRLVLHFPAVHPPVSPVEPPKSNQSVRTLPDGSILLENPLNGAPFEKVLPDGTGVWVCAGSVVLYSDRPDGKTREVTVTGQAAFEVAKNSRKPFIVHAGTTVIKVLGTYFNVMNFADEPDCRITLIRGKLQVINGSRMQYLKSSEQMVVNDSRMQVRKMDRPLARLSWASNPPFFNFREEDFGTEFRDLARTYQVKIFNPENFCGKPIEGTFLKSDSLQKILRIINLAANDDIYLEYKGDTIYVDKR